MTRFLAVFGKKLALILANNALQKGVGFPSLFLPHSSLLHEGPTSSQRILEMIGRCDEPPELAQKYVGDSLEVQLVRQLLLRAARVDDTVLLLGDTGTGKELVARAIHDFSKRANQNFTRQGLERRSGRDRRELISLR